MKKSLFSILLAGLMFASCSESTEPDFFNEDNLETRAADSNPLIITSPTVMYFTAETAIVPVSQTLNVKVAGLPSLGVLTAINATVQGPDQDKFTVTVPELSISDIFGLLLGNGLDITVTYSPGTEAGTFEAELLIETSLLGMIAPMQTTVPLHGEFQPLAIEVVSFTPPAGSVINFVEDDPSTENENGNTQQGFYNFTITFNQPVSYTGGAVISGSARVVSVSYSGNSVTFRMRDDYASIGLETRILFDNGAFAASPSYNDVSNEAFTYTYIVGERPE